MQNETKGYLVVASRKSNFYSGAINLIESVKDYYPEANVCLVTEERFCDGRESIADHLIYCSDHYRSKMWGMARSPYDITFYMDADMECVHEDISKVFDNLKDDDMVFTGLPRDRWYVFKDTEFPGGTFTLAGAVCLYRSARTLVREFMHDWFNYYCKQHDGSWWPLDENNNFDTYHYPHHLRVWDQFTLWWLTNKEDKYKELKISIFEDDLRWNYWTLLDRLRNMPTQPIILMHYSNVMEKDKPLNQIMAGQY